MFTEIDDKRSLLDQKRPLPSHTLRSIREHLIVNWTYHSNAIEGNTFTLSETKVALEGITIGGKTIREHLEVINHKEAIIYVEEIVGRQEPLTEWQIKNIHRLIMKSIDDEHAGVYRKENVIISGAKHIPPNYIQIHPFIDGNGRTARLLLNFELMKNGYPPIVIEKEDRSEYYTVLDLAHTTGDNIPFCTLIAKTLDRTFDLYLKLV